MNYAFNHDNLLVSGMEVEGERRADGRTDIYEWDVYRFRNALTSEYLTACVGQYKTARLTESVLHIVRGEAYSDTSFADYAVETIVLFKDSSRPFSRLSYQYTRGHYSFVLTM